MKNIIIYNTLFIFLISNSCIANTKVKTSEIQKVTVKIDFAATLQDWDGFGVNYVQMAQSTDPVTDPQEYGGFSRLTEEKRQEIIDLIFGEDGLNPNIIKMFLDPFHQREPGAAFDHESTTAWMRYFVHQGIQKTKERNGQDIEIITTLYGPPAWATQQKFLRGRDLDSAQYENLARYMIEWVKFLVEKENLPVKYLSLHNEGDAPGRWPLDGSHGNIGTGHDYNAFWRSREVVNFLEFMPPMIKKAGLEVGLTPGESTTWKQFYEKFYAWAIHDNEKALNNMALITSHAFGPGNDVNPWANNILRLKRPELHSWTTSMTWGGQLNVKDYQFMDYIRLNIYKAKVNAVIPWATLQTLTWVGGDPNPGTVFLISEDGNYEVKPQYYYFKQLCRVGQRGMKVATVETEEESGIELIAFSSNGTNNPDAFLVMNLSATNKEVSIGINGAGSDEFVVTRSSEIEKYINAGTFTAKNGELIYEAPAGSVSTFVVKQ